MGANDYNSREELERVVIKARHRRWETAEINVALFEMRDAPDVDYYCDCADCLQIWAWNDDPPPIPRVTLFDAYIARRLRR